MFLGKVAEALDRVWLGSGGDSVMRKCGRFWQECFSLVSVAGYHEHRKEMLPGKRQTSELCYLLQLINLWSVIFLLNVALIASLTALIFMKTSKDVRTRWLQGFYSVIIKNRFSCAADVPLKAFLKQLATTVLCKSFPWGWVGKFVCK